VTPSRPPPEAQDTPRKTPLPPAERLMAAAEEEEEGEGYRPMADPAGPLSRERREERKEQRARPRPTRGGGGLWSSMVWSSEPFADWDTEWDPSIPGLYFRKGRARVGWHPLGRRFTIHGRQNWTTAPPSAIGSPVGDRVPRRRSGPPSAIGSPVGDRVPRRRSGPPPAAVTRWGVGP